MSNLALHGHALNESHIDGGLVLSRAANWNQLDADWRLFLQVGEGWGVSAGDELVATTMVIPYVGPLVWVSVVLVAPTWRRQGLARRLTVRANEWADRVGQIAMLDATPAGREVYVQLGYVDTWSLERMTLAAPPNVKFDEGDVAFQIRPMQPHDLHQVIAYDAAVFGVGRAALLTHLLGRLRGAALVAEADGRLCGFLLGRDGRLASFLGPLAAQSPAIALALLRRALQAVPMPWTVDVPSRQSVFRDALLELGFTASRPFWRMVRPRRAGDAAATFEDAARYFASAGPEFG